MTKVEFQYSKKIGERIEAIILAELLKRGYNVLIPWGDSNRYDLVVEKDGKFQRLQCKTGQLRQGLIYFGDHSNQYAGKRYYTKDDVEALVIYCEELQKLYWVPTSIKPIRSPLRIDPTKNRQLKKVRWAKDFQI